MKRIYTILSLLILATSISAQEKSKTEIDGIIAVVADEIILRSELEEQYTQYARSGVEINEDSRCFIFEELLFQKLLLNQAELDSVVVDETQIQSELDRRINYFVQQVGSIEKLEEFYGKSIRSIKSEFYDLIKDQLTVQQMKAQVAGNITVSPKDVREFYNSIPEDSLPFINAEVEVAHIVIDPQVSQAEKDLAKSKVEGFRQRILNGEDFGTIAYLYSEDPGSAQQNGELGFMTRGMLVPEFAAVAFTLQPGQVSEIVETEFGFHLIQVIEKKGQEVNARHILVKPKISTKDLVYSKSKLDSIRQQIVNVDSISFEEMAEKYSTDKETKLNGGKLINPASGETRYEMNQLSQVDPGLFFVLDKMQVGEVSEPVVYQKRDGSKAYRLVKLLLVTEPHRANLKDDYQRIQVAAKGEREDELLKEWIANKIKGTYIKLDDSYENCSFQYNWF